MSNSELNETLESIARSRVSVRRDTILYFRSLDHIEKINRELKKAISELAKKVNDHD